MIRREAALRAALAALAVLGLFVAALLLEPVWATNDDVALAMLGSGFGIAAEPTPQLVFAHPLYGVLIGALNPLAGSAAHGWLTLGALALSAGLLGWCVATGAAGALSLGALWLAFLLPATLAPQFTLTSGLLFAAGVAPFLTPGSPLGSPSGSPPGTGRPARALGLLALVLAFIIRPTSILLGLLLLAPVLATLRPWRPGPARALLIGLGAILVAGYATDWLAARAMPEWEEAFRANQLRALFTDFHRVPWVPDHPAYRAAGWTEDDYRLFQAWYPFHPIFAPDRLAEIVRAVALPVLAAPPDRLFAWFPAPFRSPALGLALLLAAALVLRVRPWARAAALATGVVACLLLLGWSGRPPLDRVWLSLLGILGLGAAALGAGARRPFLAAGALVLGGVIAAGAVGTHRARLDEARAYRAWLATERVLAPDVVVVWGDALTWEWAVPVLSPARPFRPDGVIGIGALADSPVQRAVRARLGVADVSARLCAEGNATLVALPASAALLARFCAGRYGERTVFRPVAQRGVTSVYAVLPAGDDRPGDVR